MNMKMNLDVKDVTVCGDVLYETAQDDHSKGLLAVVDHKFTALLFPVNKKCTKVLKKAEEARDTYDRSILLEHLMAPLRDHVEAPMLRVIATAFNEPDIPETWDVVIGYTPGKDGTMYRAYMLRPPEDKKALREPYEYVSHLLTGVRERGPVMKITFGHGSEEDEDSDDYA